MFFVKMPPWAFRIAFLAVLLAAVIIIVPKGQGGMVPSGAIQDIESIMGKVQIVELDVSEASPGSLPPLGPQCHNGKFGVHELRKSLSPGATIRIQGGSGGTTLIRVSQEARGNEIKIAQTYQGQFRTTTLSAEQFDILLEEFSGGYAGATVNRIFTQAAGLVVNTIPSENLLGFLGWDGQSGCP